MRRAVTSIIAAIFMTTAIGTSAFAKDETKINPGITPDSILYPIDRLVENIQLSLTSDSAKKVGLLMNISNERFDEAQAMIDKNKEDKSVKALEDGQKSIEDAEKIVKDKDEDKNAEKDKAFQDAKTKLGEFAKDSAARLLTLADKKESQGNAQVVLRRVAWMQQVNYLEKLIKKAEKEGTDTASLKDELGRAESAYKDAQKAVEAYKSEPKNQEKDNDKNTQPNNGNANGKDKDKQNNGQSKDKKNKTN